MRTLLGFGLGFLALWAALSPCIAIANDTDAITILQRQVADLTRALQDVQASQRGQIPALQAVGSDGVPGQRPKKADGLEWHVGGYAKFDAVFSSRSAGVGSIADDFIVNSAIPATSVGEKDQLKFQARESRLWFSGTKASENGIGFKVHLEGDFFGTRGLEQVNNPHQFRLRQAHGGLTNLLGGSSLLMGQSWTTFQNLAAFPQTTTLGVLPGQVFQRQAQVRLTVPINERFNAQVAVENPETTLFSAATGATVLIPDDDRLPDFIARVNLIEKWGTASIAALVRQLRCNASTGCGGSDKATDSGVSIAGRIYTIGQGNTRDNLRFQMQLGRGMGHYGSGGIFPAAVLNAAGNIDPVDSFAFTLGYQHWWNRVLNSALIYNYANASGLNTVAAATDDAQSLNANIMWWLTPRALRPRIHRCISTVRLRRFREPGSFHQFGAFQFLKRSSTLSAGES